MDFQRLQYFLAVAEELHFGRAAERLQVTPSPLSKQIRQLERELGGDLFVRDYHSVRLTPLGRSLVEPVRDILERVDLLKEIAGPRSARLRVGCTPLAPAGIMDLTLEGLAEVAHGVPIETWLAPTVQLLPRLEARKLDFAIVHQPVPTENVVVFNVGHYDFVVAMRHDDVLASRSSLSLSDLADGTLAQAAHSYHPTHLRNLREQVRAAGVNIFDVADGNPQIIAAHVRLQGMRALVPDIPGHPSRAHYESDVFALVPLAGQEVRNYVGFAARRVTLRENPALRSIFLRMRRRWSGETGPDQTEEPGTDQTEL